MSTETIPEWIHVWHWQRLRTMRERQIANTESKRPIEERKPVRMRDFPQFENPYPTDGGCATYASPNAYSIAEYEQIRSEWIEAGSPEIGSVAEIMVGTVG